MGVGGWPPRRRVGRLRAAPRRAQPLGAPWRGAHESARRHKTAPAHSWCGAGRERSNHATGRARRSGCPAERAPPQARGSRRGRAVALWPRAARAAAAARRPRSLGCHAARGARRDGPRPRPPAPRATAPRSRPARGAGSSADVRGLGARPPCCHPLQALDPGREARGAVATGSRHRRSALVGAGAPDRAAVPPEDLGLGLGASLHGTFPGAHPPDLVFAALRGMPGGRREGLGRFVPGVTGAPWVGPLRAGRGDRCAERPWTIGKAPRKGHCQRLRALAAPRGAVGGGADRKRRARSTAPARPSRRPQRPAWPTAGGRPSRARRTRP
jgi:hypothetical protein